MADRAGRVVISDGSTACETRAFALNAMVVVELRRADAHAHVQKAVAVVIRGEDGSAGGGYGESLIVGRGVTDEVRRRIAFVL